MLNTLKLVRGAVADRDLVPALTHFFIYQGRIQGANSRIAIDAPLPELPGISITVPAERFIKAIDLCDGEPTVTVETDRVWIKQGAFRVKLPILANDAFPRTVPDPLAWETESPLLPIVKALAPFIASDANQGWPLGVWLEEDWAYATNNVALLRKPCDFLNGTGQSANLPGYAVEELLAIGREPVGFGVSDNSITFHYDDGTWFKTQLIAVPWPVETLRRLYAGKKFRKMSAVPKGLLDAVEKVLPFCPNEGFPVVLFADTAVTTEDGEFRAEVAGFDLPDAKYNGNILKLILEHATHLAPAAEHNLFMADDAEGIFSGLKV